MKKKSGGIENLIRRMLKKHSSPLMLIQEDTLEKQFRIFRKTLPEVTPYYAIKANPYPGIIKKFIELGAGFDVASANEMNTVLELGASPEKIIFANTIKSNEDIKIVHKKKVKLMTFDNEPELYKIAKYCPGAKVIIRIKVANVGSIVELSLKFGADPEQSISLLKKARSLGLKPIGVSFHVGSQCTNAENYLQALEISSAIFNEAKQSGIFLNILDIKRSDILNFRLF